VPVSVRVVISLATRAAVLAVLPAVALTTARAEAPPSKASDVPAANASSSPERASTTNHAAADTRVARRAAPGNLVGHGGPVKAIAVDSATQRVLTGSFDYSAMVWDIAGETPRMLQRFADFEGAVNAVAFVPGSDRFVAGGDDGDVWLWEISGKTPVARLKGHTGKINAIAVSADGHLAVSSSWDRTARIWDLRKCEPGPVLAGHKGPVNAAIFSADAQYVYTASYDGTIIAWRTADGTRLRTIYSHGWGINVLALVPGEGPPRLIFGALNGAIGVVDPENGGLTATLPGYERPVLSIAVTAKPGLVATGSGDGSIRVVRSGDWAPIEEFSNTFGPVWALAFIGGGTALYYGGLDDFALKWQVEPRAPFEPIESKYPRRFQVSETNSLGELQFARKCSVCHTLGADDRNRAGPTLHGLFGRRAGSISGYPYSNALKGSDIVWTEVTIGKLFELGPEHYTPGSKMPLQKITDKETREALIAFLKSATTDDGDTHPTEPQKAGQAR